MSKPTIFVISGSTAARSSNRAVVEIIRQNFADLADFDVCEGVDLLPHFRPDADQAALPQNVLDFRRRIEAADGVLFCTPEYVFSLPGSLKNAIDWTVSTTVFYNKAIGIVVAAASGEKAMESLMLILTTIEARVEASATLIVKGAKGKIDQKGALSDPPTADALHRMMLAFLELVHRENPTPTKYA
ncbi:MAG TPA: NAD(P)H-dependent oxidoreductase [Calditrichia bacterium]|nr:NAD(P)H-dependent oxidoreductase [Calditrichota bacterium]HQV33725.1 NAD(P)H-dependent oxidoreductase [Calditrichia bacterium]